MNTNLNDHDIPADQARKLRAAALRLQDRFAGIYGIETIERFMLAWYADLKGRVTVDTYLELLAERFTAERLTALARIEGKSNDDRPIVLFLCTHNAGRSQMALGFFREMAGDAAIAWSGGSEPGNAINPSAIAVMAEDGIDISGEFPKPWSDETVRAADVVITMGCGDACPIFPGKRYEDWQVPDPAGLSVEEVRPIRDDIRERVAALLGELSVPAQA